MRWITVGLLDELNEAFLRRHFKPPKAEMAPIASAEAPSAAAGLTADENSGAAPEIGQ